MRQTLSVAFLLRPRTDPNMERLPMVKRSRLTKSSYMVRTKSSLEPRSGLRMMLSLVFNSFPSRYLFLLSLKLHPPPRRRMSPNLPPTRLLPPVPLLLLLDPPLLMLMLVLMLMLELPLKLPLSRTPMPQLPEVPATKSPMLRTSDVMNEPEI